MRFPLLDQAIAHGAGKVEEAQVRAMLGTVDLDYLLFHPRSGSSGDAGNLLRLSGRNRRCVAFRLAVALQDLRAADPPANCLRLYHRRLDLTRIRTASVSAPWPSAFSPEFVQLAYQIVIHGRKELSVAPDEYAGFVMTLLRLHGFRPESVADVVQAVSSVQRAAQRRLQPCRAIPAPPRALAAGAVQRAGIGSVGAPGNGWHDMVAALSFERSGTRTCAAL
jgi:DNA polymerase-3 subunit gamma/tau